MLIAYAATRNIYHKMIPSMRSLLEHNDAEILVLAEDDEIPIDIPCKVINVSGQEYFKGKNKDTVFTYMSLMRLALAKITDYDKVLYLDVDTIVCDSLLPAWGIDMGNKYWAAVEEVHGKWKPFGEHYYNAGVSLFNLKKIRENGIDDILINCVNRLTCPFPDQDVLNLVCVPERIIPLPVRYNENFATGITMSPALLPL